MKWGYTLFLFSMRIPYLRPANEIYLYVYTEPILGLRPANLRRRYRVTPPLIGWVQTKNQPCLYAPGAHFIYDFSIVIKMGWKFHTALIQVVVKWSLRYFAHGTTALLSWHVQNFVAIWYRTRDSNQNHSFVEFESWWKISFVKWAPELDHHWCG